METLQQLFKAIRRNDIGKVKELLSQGVPLNEVYEGHTPLTFAASRLRPAPRPEAVKVLLEAGADIDGRNVMGETALHNAATAEIAKILIDAGANLNAQTDYGSTPLHLAACNEETAQMKVLLKHGALVDVVDNEQNTPLMKAAEDGDAKAVDLLIAAGANLNHRGEYGCTPLMTTVQGRQRARLRIVKALLEAGADVNAISDVDRSALMYACEMGGSAEIVQTLLEAGADLNVKTCFGETAFALAKQQGRGDLVEILTAAGAKE